MAKNQVRRLSLKRRKTDTDGFAALEGIEGYNPSKAGCKVSDIEPIAAEMKAAQVDEVQALGVYNGKRDVAIAKEWAFHNALLTAKAQVIAQFGDDSLEVQKIGLKRKSEYRSPRAKRQAAPKAGNG